MWLVESGLACCAVEVAAPPGLNQSVDKRIDLCDILDITCILTAITTGSLHTRVIPDLVWIEMNR